MEAGAPAARAAALASASAGQDGAFAIAPSTHPLPPPLAFIGVRSCELHAIQIQDRVLAGGAHADDDYDARRRDAFIVAVNCGEAGRHLLLRLDGDRARRSDAGYDLALTELLDGDGHRFLVEVGSERGAEVARRAPARPAEPRDRRAAARRRRARGAQMGRTLDTEGLAELLQRNREHPRWEEVADRCLTCGNCTLVCPTCFCTTVEDVTDLDRRRGRAPRRRGTRASTSTSAACTAARRASRRASRYRQWMTHKLSTWWDQFGTSGCVGCGRCITWCPVGIDITEEAAAIRATDGAVAEEGDDVGPVG